MSNRTEYWNDKYLEYFRSRVSEGNDSLSQSSVIEGDSVVASDALYESFIEQTRITKDSVVLELGCGFGRSLPYLSSKAARVIAVDISEEMIKCAQAEHGTLQNVEYLVSEAEHIDLADGSVDAIICFGVFDALYQVKALVEANRLLSRGGVLLVTGKNDNYMVDDELALLAERNARVKGHPNYFTDVELLLGELPGFGFSVVRQRFFLRRGDMTKKIGQSDLPGKFYEYMFVLRKESEPAGSTAVEISSEYSRTYRRIRAVNATG